MREIDDRFDAQFDRELPPEVANGFQTVLGLSEAPETLGEWADETRSVLDDHDFEFGAEHLCLTDESRHEARVAGETRYFRCVLDALLLPLLVAERPVHVRSRGPVTDAVVTMAVTDEDVTTDPETAVVSFGLDAGVDREAPPGQVTRAFGYAAFCPYVNAFPTREAYEEWDERTATAATTALTPTEAIAAAAAITNPDR
ncbi:organomercurial lyase [Halobacterium bonnevillei]|uniref:Alkylmercury lyase n=1 Tax=Halobacterium bonnevillei TaxID=2692200 RepID=A0A6B0SH72_9EURY|nr:organomercurial lyase [Halobacterium bonnevillei]MXR20978.1 hypothetical protein [Halobacterium bonnevillei]